MLVGENCNCAGDIRYGSTSLSSSLCYRVLSMVFIGIVLVSASDGAEAESFADFLAAMCIYITISTSPISASSTPLSNFMPQYQQNKSRPSPQSGINILHDTRNQLISLIHYAAQIQYQHFRTASPNSSPRPSLKHSAWMEIQHATPQPGLH